MSTRHTPDQPHPYREDLRYERDDDMQAELRAEQRRRPRTCLECGCTGYHTAGCPAQEDGDE